MADFGIAVRNQIALFTPRRERRFAAAGGCATNDLPLRKLRGSTLPLGV
jgi:hypothetical protein